MWLPTAWNLSIKHISYFIISYFYELSFIIPTQQVRKQSQECLPESIAIEIIRGHAEIQLNTV